MSVHRKTATDRQKRKKQKRAAAAEASGVQPSAAATASATAKSQPAPKPAAQPKTSAPESGLSGRWHHLQRMIQNTWAEIKKITWPDWETTRNLTVLVIVMATFLGALLGGIDYALLQVFEAI